MSGGQLDSWTTVFCDSVAGTGVMRGERVGRTVLSTVASFYVILPMLLVLCVVALFLRAQQLAAGQRANRQITWLVVVLLVIYLGVYAYLTFFYRTPASKSMARLTPFWSYREGFEFFPFRIRRLGMAREVILNILLTIPVGLLLPLLFARRKHPYLLTAGIAILLAVVTEGLQYVTRLGYCETDDLISNFLGCLIGMAILAAGTNWIRRYLAKRDAGQREG